MIVTCSNCGIKFNKPPCQVARVKKVFCSKKCCDGAQTIYHSKNCEICGCAFKYRGKMSRYSTCPNPNCRREKIRREHERQRKPNTKNQRRTQLYKNQPDLRYFRTIKYLYGIDQDQYQIMSDNQKSACAICGIVKERLGIDHCHESGVIRGLLCSSCNMGLGAFKDNLELLKNAISYLERTQLIQTAPMSTTI